MKKTIFAVALVLSLGLSAFADGDKNINFQTKQSFSQEFAQASNVSWQTQKDLSVANFTYDGQIMHAYYNDQAELVALVHNVLSDHLPIFLFTTLKGNYSDYWISALSEVATEGQSNFYATLENADQIITLKSVNSTDWVIKCRVKKNTL